MARAGESNPVRTGVFGIALVVCLVLVSFGYTGLPFWPPQGKNYEAYFTDAGGITPPATTSASPASRSARSTPSNSPETPPW